MPIEPTDLNPLRRAWRTLWLLVILAFCIWAVWERFTTDVSAEEGAGYPEVKREVVEARPEVLWLGDSIKAVRTDLSQEGWIQGRVKP